MWSIMAFIVIGLVAGWAASLLVRGEMHPRDWGRLFLIGVAGSLIAGIVVNLILGYGLTLRPGGVLGSIAVACLLLWITTSRERARRSTARKTAGGTHREPKGGRKHHTKR
jgi:uncharacterized membrane protein YeaQ/YmgE (transglycosylase-associated protein family)